MTSSLVGSEMCIRDSPAKESSAKQCGFRSKRLVSVVPTSPIATHQLAVSYTHLTLPTICSV
eukprot:3548450-Prorocentrum_lima.AAC.1